jgi:hypothetical protein
MLTQLEKKMLKHGLTKQTLGKAGEDGYTQHAPAGLVAEGRV